MKKCHDDWKLSRYALAKRRIWYSLNLETAVKVKAEMKSPRMSFSGLDPLHLRSNKIYMLLLCMQEPWVEDRTYLFLFPQDIPMRGPIYPIWVLQMSLIYQFCRCWLQRLRYRTAIIIWQTIIEQTKAHASARESRFAMAQSDSVFQIKVEAKMTLGKIQNAGNTRDQRSSCMPDKIMLLCTLRIYLSPVPLRKSHWINTTLAQVSHLLERPRYSDNYRISMRAALLPMTVWSSCSDP